jgi:hypothetical protein
MTTNEALWNDLLKWQTDINKKDEALLKSKPIHDKVNNKAVPVDICILTLSKIDSTPYS